MGLSRYVSTRIKESRKASVRYCINYLFRAGVPASDIVCVYTSIIRSVLEFARPVWHPGLAKKTVKRY